MMNVSTIVLPRNFARLMRHATQAAATKTTALAISETFSDKATGSRKAAPFILLIVIVPAGGSRI